MVMSVIHHIYKKRNSFEKRADLFLFYKKLFLTLFFPGKVGFQKEKIKGIIYINYYN